MLCVKFGWNWPPGSGGKYIYKFRQSIFAKLLLSPLEKGSGPSFEHAWIPFIKECFVPSLFEIGQVVLEKKYTRGPWATTLTLENFLKIDKHIWLS